ncbi:hypothetical protein MMC07_001098 [Pseudocyphellaria aurata]|nr:hypothetical protein [Pseudocyphellaria aurata]
MDYAFATFATDIITYYVFARSYDFLNYPDFVAPFTTVFEKLSDSSQICAHFPWLVSLMASLPKAVAAFVRPSVVPYLDFRDEMTTQIRKTIDSHKKASGDEKHQADEKTEHLTVFDEILYSNLPPEELSVSRLGDEASILVSAGLDTTKTTLTIACFHILNNPSVYRQLSQELKKAFTDPIMQPTLPELEKLPYLTAVIQESLRFSYGVSQRLPRILDSAIQYGSHIIPSGVPVSMTHYIQHHDERVFPSSQTFDPDRWLDNPQAPNSSKPLTHYLVSFSKGTRNCIGMNLAYAQLYIVLATLFRRVNMELFETQRDAVDMAIDHFTQSPKKDTKGVRVLIK